MNVYDSFDSADLAFAWSAAHLAVQPVVGILPQRRIGPSRCHRDRPSSRRSLVNPSNPEWWEAASSHHLFSVLRIVVPDGSRKRGLRTAGFGEHSFVQGWLPITNLLLPPGIYSLAQLLR